MNKMNKHTSFRVGALALSIAAIGAFGYVRGAGAQGAGTVPITDTWTWVGNLLVARARLNTAKMGNDYNGARSASESLSNSTRGAIGNKARTGYLAQGWNEADDSTAQSNAFLVLQNQKLIEQNEQIIALLKAKK